MFTPKYSLLDPLLRVKIEQEAAAYGARVTATKYHEQVGMSFIGLYTRLQKAVQRSTASETAFQQSLKPGRKKSLNPAPVKMGRWGKPVKEEKELTAEEEALLDRIEQGKVGIDEMRTLIARRVFEKMLKNPDDFKFLDFFRVELLKAKQEENKIKESWAKELIGKMFAGKLPPRECPQCGYNFSSETEDGEILDEPDQSLRLTDSV